MNRASYKRRLRRKLRNLALRLAPELVYGQPAPALEPPRLYAYLDALWKRRELTGAIVEVGCWMGGTAAIAERLLRQTDNSHRYVCVDTFGGFVDAHFEVDLGHGTPKGYDHVFTGNSPETVARLLSHYGAQVELLVGDIATLSTERLPPEIAVALLDVDLEIPTYEGLAKLRPLLVRGGVILVDDCDEASEWRGARVGYKRYCRDAGISETYVLGFGVVNA